MTMSERLADLWARYVDAANWREDGDRLKFEGGYRLSIGRVPGDYKASKEDWTGGLFKPSDWAWIIWTDADDEVDGCRLSLATLTEARLGALNAFVTIVRDRYMKGEPATPGGVRIVDNYDGTSSVWYATEEGVDAEAFDDLTPPRLQ